MRGISPPSRPARNTTDFPTFKISMREYEDIGIKIGDKITIEINKSDSSSGR